VSLVGASRSECICGTKSNEEQEQQPLARSRAHLKPQTTEKRPPPRNTRAPPVVGLLHTGGCASTKAPRFVVDCRSCGRPSSLSHANGTIGGMTRELCESHVLWRGSSPRSSIGRYSPLQEGALVRHREKPCAAPPSKIDMIKGRTHIQGARHTQPRPLDEKPSLLCYMKHTDQTHTCAIQQEACYPSQAWMGAACMSAGVASHPEGKAVRDSLIKPSA
jgi:hypothetical protein